MRPRQRGSALIAVLWLTAALAAITFALAAGVRSEIERAASGSEGVRAYYLARGAVDRALLWMQWGPQYRGPDGSPLFYDFPMPRMQFRFPSGIAVVEVIPESSKYNINTVAPDDLLRLLAALGVDGGRARSIAAAVLDWRGGAGDGGGSLFDGSYLAQASSFRAPHASIRELEELLLLRGVTPDLFYGSFGLTAEGHAVWHAGLRDCLTTLGAGGTGFDINSVEPAVMASLGLDPQSIGQIVAYRRRQPIKSMFQVSGLLPAGLAGRFRIGGGSIVTLRATSRIILPDGKVSDLKRSVAALVKLEQPAQGVPFTILRWYDNVQSDIL